MSVRKLFLSFTLCFLLTHISAQIIYVNDDATGNNNGSSWENAFTSLQDALSAAAISQDDIWVAEGTYYPDEGMGLGNDNPFSSFTLINEVTVYGGFPAVSGTEGLMDFRDTEVYASTLSGDLNQNNDFDDGLDAFHVVSGGFTDSSAVIDGFYIVHGNAVSAGGGGLDLQNRGGGMFIQNGSPTVRGCNFRNNKANFYGGAISNLAAFAASSPTIEDCTFEVNFCLQGNGGAIHNEGFGAIAEISIHNSKFIKNVAFDYGGAFYGNVLEAQINGCEFMANFAKKGGAIYTQDFIILDVINSSFTSNFAEEEGGAIHNPTATVQATFINTVVSGNISGSGGGMFSNGANPDIFNCSFSGNHAAGGAGGGLANIGGSTPTISNSIFWNNLDSTGTSVNAQIFDDSSAASDVSYSTVQGAWTGASTGGNNLADDPLFTLAVDPTAAPTVEGDLSLQEDSPAINAGNNDDVPDGIDEDIAGEDRILDTTVDMGAYEFNANPNDDDELMVECQDITRSLDDNGFVEVFAEEVDGGTSGGTGNITILIDDQQSLLFDCDDVGSQTVTLTATDQDGNTASCTATITIQDDTPPLVACKDIIVELDANGNANINIDDITNLITDNCGIANTSVSQSDFDCSDVGDQSIQVNITDDNGNSNSCVSIVTVMEPLTLPSNWNSVNIGGSNGAGFYSDCQDAFVLNSDGYNPSSGADALQFVYQDLCDGGQIIARVNSIENPGFAGLGVREGNFDGARKVELLTNLGSFVYRKTRISTYGSEQTQLLFRPGHTWFRIMRAGPIFRGFTSSNGVFWQVAFQAYLPMGINECVQVGMLVHSTTAGETTTATFDNVSIGTFPTFPIVEGDISSFDQIDSESNFSNEISVYPNPAKNLAYLDLSNLAGESGLIKVFNSLGQVVHQMKMDYFPEQAIELDISQWTNGLYRIQVESNSPIPQSTQLIISN